MAKKYYYAGGKKIELTEAHDLFAVESDGPRGSAAPAAAGQALSDGLRLISKDELGESVKGLGGAKPKYPVFRSHGAVVVALPEVRVEESRQAQQASLDKWLKEHADEVTVVSRDEGRVLLRPVSGSGVDALRIANSLAKEVGPEMAQPRFIRVTPRPKT